MEILENQSAVRSRQSAKGNWQKVIGKIKINQKI